MRIVLFLFLFLSASMSISAQSSIINGTVIDSVTGIPIPYVNIGVLNKNNGTVSDHDGFFSLRTEREQGDILRLSVLGYQARDLALSTFGTDRIILLVPQTYGLEEVVVTPDDFTSEEVVLGARNTKGRGLSMGFGGEMLGTEVGSPIGVDQRVRIEKMNFVLNHAKGDSLLFRLNIYSLDGEMVGQNLLKENVLIKEKQRRGLFTIDLQPYNLVLDRDVLVSLEWLRDFEMSGSRSITFDTAKSKKPTGVYLKTTSQSGFRVLRVKRRKACFYLTGWTLPG